MAAAGLIQEWLRRLDQQQVDDWMSGKLSVTEKVAKLLHGHPMLARMYKPVILQQVEGISGEEVYRRLTRDRPDLNLGDKDKAVARISEDLQEVRKLIQAL